MYVVVGEAGGVAQIHRKLAEIKPTALDPFAGGAISFWCGNVVAFHLGLEISRSTVLHPHICCQGL